MEGGFFPFCLYKLNFAFLFDRGTLRIQNKENSISFGLMAHLSSKACMQVVEAAKALPMRLNVAIVSRSEAWPQKFQIESPTDGSIGLYFFPQHERLSHMCDFLDYASSWV